MSEQERIMQMQEQMNKVKRTINQATPLIVFLTQVFGGISLAVGSYFGQPWLLVGLVIFGVCTGLTMFTARNVKEQYNKLLEQMNGVVSKTKNYDI